MPLDIIIDTKREGGVERLSTLRRIEQFARQFKHNATVESIW